MVERIGLIERVRSAIIPNSAERGSSRFHWKNALFFAGLAFIAYELGLSFELLTGQQQLSSIDSQSLFRASASVLGGMLLEWGRSKIMSVSSTKKT